MRTKNYAYVVLSFYVVLHLAAIQHTYAQVEINQSSMVNGQKTTTTDNKGQEKTTIIVTSDINGHKTLCQNKGNELLCKQVNGGWTITSVNETKEASYLAGEMKAMADRNTPVMSSDRFCDNGTIPYLGVPLDPKACREGYHNGTMTQEN